MSDTPQNTRDGSEVTALETSALAYVQTIHNLLVTTKPDITVMEVTGVAVQVLVDTLKTFYDEPISKISQSESAQGKDGGSGQVQEAGSEGGQSEGSEGTSEAKPRTETGNSPKKRRGKKK